MNSFAIVRFTRQHSEDDDVIRAVREQAGKPASGAIEMADLWNQIVHEIAASDLPTKGARMLHYEEMEGGPGEDRYVIYGLVPSIDDEAVEFATRLQRTGYDEGMAGLFQVIAMVSPGAVGLLYPASEAFEMRPSPAIAA